MQRRARYAEKLLRERRLAVMAQEAASRKEARQAAFGGGRGGKVIGKGVKARGIQEQGALRNETRARMSVQGGNETRPRPTLEESLRTVEESFAQFQAVCYDSHDDELEDNDSTQGTSEND